MHADFGNPEAFGEVVSTYRKAGFLSFLLVCRYFSGRTMSGIGLRVRPRRGHGISPVVFGLIVFCKQCHACGLGRESLGFASAFIVMGVAGLAVSPMCWSI